MLSPQVAENFNENGNLHLLEGNGTSICLCNDDSSHHPDPRTVQRNDLLAARTMLRKESAHSPPGHPPWQPGRAARPRSRTLGSGQG
jgi:hypothetical protein